MITPALFALPQKPLPNIPSGGGAGDAAAPRIGGFGGLSPKPGFRIPTLISATMSALPSPRSPLLPLFLLLLLTGCTAQATPQPQPLATQLVTSEGPGTQQGRFKLTLTLSSPDDLKVREGDAVVAGQVLGDRTRERQRLEAQKQKLELQMARLKQAVPGPPLPHAVPEVATLPNPSFGTQVAEIEREKLKAAQAERNLNQQQRKLDLLQSLPAADIPPATLPHEQEVLAQREREVQQANAAIEFANAQLTQAQKEREYQEYLHSLELSKRAIALQQGELERQRQLQEQQRQERDRAFQLAQLEAQIQQLDTQLANLSSIRSPYSGKVSRIKFQEQRDQALSVELVLLLSGAPTRSGAARLTPRSPAQTQTPSPAPLTPRSPADRTSDGEEYDRPRPDER